VHKFPLLHFVVEFYIELKFLFLLLNYIETICGSNATGDKPWIRASDWA